jgi:hypothetical protein
MRGVIAEYANARRELRTYCGDDGQNKGRREIHERGQ